MAKLTEVGTGQLDRRRPAILLFCLAVAAAISLLYVRETDDLATTGYDVARLNTEIDQWTMRNEQLQLTVAQLESLDRVEMVASTRLGLGPPRRVVYVTAPPVQLPTPVAVATRAADKPTGPLPTPWRAVANTP